MINYAKLNEWVLENRKGRLMVVYKEGSKTESELHSIRKNLKSFYFISDEQQLLRTICGYQFGGVIVEEGVDLTYPNMQYALSRLRTEDPDFIFVMNNKHRERLGDILEEMQAWANDKSFIDDFVDQMRFCKLENEYLVEDGAP